MKTRNSTKSKLLSSVIALVLCVSMLIGATFAWFTDTASTGVNKIQAGNLDVELEMEDTNGDWVNAEGKTLSWVKADGHTEETVLWEPGCTYQLPELRIRNNGNLKLKYQIAISGIQGDAELNNAIEWTINDTALGSDHPLEPGASDTLTIKGHMKETAGNEYQGKSIDNIAITVRAAQLGGTYGTVSGEFDSAGNDYDATAPYCEWPVVVNQAVAKDPSGNPTGQTLTKYVSADVQAQVEIPAAAVDPNAAQMILKVEKSTAPGNFTIAAGQDSKTYEVKVEGLRADNDTPVKAKIFVGIGLTGVTLTHNGNDAFTDKGSAANYTGADKTFYYNSTDGYIYFASKTFSPFSAAFDAPVGISGEGTMKETYYPTAEKAQEAADNGTTVTATQKVEIGEDGNKETIEQGQNFKTPVAKCGDVRYYTFKEAITSIRNGETTGKTITLLKDITVTNEDTVDSYDFYWKDEVDAVIPILKDDTIFDGNGHTITSRISGGYLICSVVNATIKNLKVHYDNVQNAAIVYSSQNSVFENVTTSGTLTWTTGNNAAFTTYPFADLTMTDCVNEATLQTYTGDTSAYCAVFNGYALGTGTFNMTNCVNNGSLICGKASMFLANWAYSTRVDFVITNCKNNGVIRSMTTGYYGGAGQYNYCTSDYWDKAHCLTFTFDDGVKYTSSTAKKWYDIDVQGSLIGTGTFEFGPFDNTLALTQNSDGTFTITPASVTADRYVVSVGTYYGLPNGSCRAYVTETVTGTTTTLKALGFVSQKWVNAHQDAVSGTWNGYTTYTLGGVTYYLIDDTEATDTSPRGPEMISVSAFNGDTLVASAQLAVE